MGLGKMVNRRRKEGMPVNAFKGGGEWSESNEQLSLHVHSCANYDDIIIDRLFCLSFLSYPLMVSIELPSFSMSLTHGGFAAFQLLSPWTWPCPLLAFSSSSPTWWLLSHSTPRQHICFSCTQDDLFMALISLLLNRE